MGTVSTKFIFSNSRFTAAPLYHRGKGVYITVMVADELSLPFDRISLEMIFRGLYHFSVAQEKGQADDPVKYFAAKENLDLGVVKSVRKPVSKLDLSPFTAPS